MLSPFRHSPNLKHMKHLNHAATVLTNTNLRHAFTWLSGRNYADDKAQGQGCCQDVAQTTGMKVEPWPKPDTSPQPWRAECPQGPQPPNYDPYRIKVPETVVPPLPPSNVKRIGVLSTASDDQDQERERQQTSAGYQQQGYQQQGYQQGWQQGYQGYGEEEPKTSFLGKLKGFFGKLSGKGKHEGGAMMSGSQEYPTEDSTELFKNPAFSLQSSSSVQDLFYNSPIVHPDYWKDKPSKRLAEVVKEVLPNLGYHGKTKYKYAFHEPWKPLDRITLLQEAEQQELELIEDTTRTTKKAETYSQGL